MERVLAIDELLELILSHLDMRTLLLAQRVSRRFQSLITSPRLQAALFFRPTPQRIQKGFADITKRSCKYIYKNDLLAWAFPAFYQINVDDHYAFEVSTFCEFPWNKSEQSTSAFRRPEASWRKMLVCDPPIAASSFHLKSISMMGTDYSNASFNCSDGGLRMGTLYDTAQYHVVQRGSHRNPIVGFRMAWPILENQEYPPSKWEGGQLMYINEKGKLEVDVHVEYFYVCIVTETYGNYERFRSEAVPKEVVMKLGEELVLAED